MQVQQMQEYKALKQAVMLSNNYDEEQSEWALECAMTDIEEGDESYASAAEKLGLSVRLNHAGFDAADYLSCIV